jgi:hypothetical protein
MEAKPGLVLMSGSLVEAVSLLEWSSWVRGWKGLDAERVLRECFMAARKVGQNNKEVVGKRSSVMCRANFVSSVESKMEWEEINSQLGGSCCMPAEKIGEGDGTSKGPTRSVPDGRTRGTWGHNYDWDMLLRSGGKQ